MNIYRRPNIEGKIIKWDGSRFYELTRPHHGSQRRIILHFTLPNIPMICILSNNELYIVDYIPPEPMIFRERLRYLNRYLKRDIRKLSDVHLVDYTLSTEQVGIGIYENEIVPGKFIYMEKNNTMKVNIIRIMERNNHIKFKCRTPSGKNIIVTPNKKFNYLFKEGKCVYNVDCPKEGDIIEISYEKMVSDTPCRAMLQQS